MSFRNRRVAERVFPVEMTTSKSTHTAPVVSPNLGAVSNLKSLISGEKHTEKLPRCTVGRLACKTLTV